MSGELEFADFLCCNSRNLSFELEAENPISTPDRILRRILKSAGCPIGNSFYRSQTEAGLREPSKIGIHYFLGKTIAYVCRVEGATFRVVIDSDLFQEAIRYDEKLKRAYKIFSERTPSGV
ncbi:MAG: hypothetical protein AABY05_03585 [Nanoarchaeota archaeon]